MNKKIMKSFLIFCIAYFILVVFMPRVDLFAKTLIDKKTKKTYKIIDSREELLKEFKKHVFKLDKKFKIFVDNRVVGDFKEEFRGIWSELCEDMRFNEIWKNNTAYKSQFKFHSHSKAECWEWDVKKMTFSISKEEAAKIAERMKKVLSTKKDLVNEYSSSVIEMDENFSLLVSKKVLPDFKEAYDDFLNDLFAIPELLNIMEYAEVVESTPYEYNNHWKWDVKINYNISKETFDEIIYNKPPVLKTREQIMAALVEKMNRLDNKIILRIDNKVLDFSDAKHYEDFWNYLYKNPNFSDLYSYTKDFKHKLVKHKKYKEWIIDLDYNIKAKDIASLKDYIQKVNKEELTDKTSDEKKIYALNKFFVENFELDYGSEGRTWYFNGNNSGIAKRGKYNVNTSFALMKNKGGSSEAFASLFFRLAKEADLDVKVVFGKKGEERFVWNMVKVDGKWYHISTIHDMDENKEKVNGKLHYLKDDETMKKTYTWDEKAYPVVKNDY